MEPNVPTVAPHGFVADKLETFDADLKALKTVLSTGTYTAKALAKRFKCSKQAIYYRVEALKSAGVKVVTNHIREGKAGPKSRAYTLGGRND